MQSSSKNVTTNKHNTHFFTGRMPFLSPNQQCQSTEGKYYMYKICYIIIIILYCHYSSAFTVKVIATLITMPLLCTVCKTFLYNDERGKVTMSWEELQKTVAIFTLQQNSEVLYCCSCKKFKTRS